MARSTVRRAAPAKRPGRRNRYAGSYSFRFSGFGVGPQAESFHVTGLGRLELKRDNSLTGVQFSSECPMSIGMGQPSKNFGLTFNLTGRYDIDNSGIGHADVVFRDPQGNPIQSDTFKLVAADRAATRFWLISTNPMLGGTGVPELASGEVIRLR